MVVKLQTCNQAVQRVSSVAISSSHNNATLAAAPPPMPLHAMYHIVLVTDNRLVRSVIYVLYQFENAAQLVHTVHLPSVESHTS